DGGVELIPVGKCSAFAISLDGHSATAEAIDEETNPLGPAETRVSRGLVYVTPVPGAFSYLLKPAASPTVSLKCERERVVPGESVTIAGRTEHAFRVPSDAAPGERLWRRFDDAWIDFTVFPLVTAKLNVDGALRLKLTPHLPSASEASLTLGSDSQVVMLVPEKTIEIEFPLEASEREEVREVPLKVTAGDLVHEGKWWLKAEESILPIAKISKRIETGQRLRDGVEKALGDETRAHALWTERSCGNEMKPCLFMHPPYVGGVGYSFALLEPVELPKEPQAAFRCEIGKADGSDPGDGILFRVAVVDADGAETLVAEKQWIQHAWTPLEADLAPWAGKQVRIKLTSDVGPDDNSSGDWACWTALRIETAGPALRTTVHDHPVELTRREGPFPLGGLTVDNLRQATGGVLHYQGIGLQCGGQYVSHGRLNGIELGELPAAGGREGQGVWSDAAMTLTAEAIASLGEWNPLEIENPGRDSFKIGRFWIELELADGRKASSQITTTIFTQPPEWPYAEGTLVPFDEPIRVEIRFHVLRNAKGR
ncbi:MAG: hypothetical protein ABIK89_02540, partial [Planctomycetota bacterium]